MSPSTWPFADFQLGLWISANSIVKIKSNLLTDEKAPQVSCLGYTSILIIFIE